MSKRLFDLVLAALGLLALALPMLAIGLAIRLDSPGPALFRQVRVGRYGRPFRIHKFRTMRHHDGADGPLITVGADPRVTRLGRWLRRSKLDELPQLLDVLYGDMSLVGPRPEVPRYVERYPAAVRAAVLSVRPGITDEASLLYRRESERLASAANPEADYLEYILPAKLLICQSYASRHNLWGDLVILLRTLALLFRRH